MVAGAGPRPPQPAAPVRQNEAVSQTIEAPVRVHEPEQDESREVDRPWVVIVWNDPVNLMTYVTYVFQKLFGYDREKAEKLMLQVHHEGKAAVSTGTREKAESDVARLHAAGLWATMQQD
jgi:ATP-dependent Clp protease adaptor protein ClpS